MKDNDIISGIKQGGSQAEAVINYLFDKNRGLVGSAIKKHQLTEEEALDAYSDAILGLRKQILADKFRGESKLSTYLYTIFQRRCVDSIRKKATHRIHTAPEYPDVADDGQNMERDMITQEMFDKLMGYMNKLGEACRKVLMYRYYWGYEDMGKIAELAGIKNANTAGSLRYRCMKQLMKMIKDLPNGNF